MERNINQGKAMRYSTLLVYFGTLVELLEVGCAIVVATFSSAA
jgi:hypothetical protein